MIWEIYFGSIRLFLDNEYVFAPFWKFQNGDEACANWQDRLAGSKAVMRRALSEKDSATLLSILFDRLYVLRNQLMHGGATWNSSVNRDQVRDGRALLASLVPVFIEIMMDNPSMPWGQGHYPVVEADAG